MVSVSDQIYVEAWGVTEALHRLGFASESIRFVVGDFVGIGGGQLGVELRAQGLSYLVYVGPAPGGLEQCSAALNQLQDDLRDQGLEARQAAWKSTQIATRAELFMLLAEGLMRTGFYLPRLVN